MRQVAAEEGWDTLAVVTSDYHARRAAYLLRQCVTADVTVIEVGRVRNLVHAVGWVIHETGGLLDSWLRPECG